jgi:prevent-host-death family protein
MTIVMTMGTVAKNALKSQLLAYLRKVEQSGEELIVTDRGVPVVKIVPYAPVRTTEMVFRDWRGKVRYNGDILESTEDEWPET